MSDDQVLAVTGSRPVPWVVLPGGTAAVALAATCAEAAAP